MKPKKQKPRINVEITSAQAASLKKHLPHGSRKLVFGKLLENLITLLNAHGRAAVIGILKDRIGLGYRKEKKDE